MASAHTNEVAASTMNLAFVYHLSFKHGTSKLTQYSSSLGSSHRDLDISLKTIESSEAQSAADLPTNEFVDRSTTFSTPTDIRSKDLDLCVIHLKVLISGIENVQRGLHPMADIVSHSDHKMLQRRYTPVRTKLDSLILGLDSEAGGPSRYEAIQAHIECTPHPEIFRLIKYSASSTSEPVNPAPATFAEAELKKLAFEQDQQSRTSVQDDVTDLVAEQERQLKMIEENVQGTFEEPVQLYSVRLSRQPQQEQRQGWLRGLYRCLTGASKEPDNLKLETAELDSLLREWTTIYD